MFSVKLFNFYLKYILSSISNLFELDFFFEFVIYIIYNIRSNFNYFPQLHRAVSKKTDIYLFQLHEILFSSILDILLTSKLSYSLFYNQLRGNIRHDGVAFFFSVEKEAKRSLGSLLTPVTYVYYPSSLP